MTLKTLSVASECVPLVKTGGLADVVGSLPPPEQKFTARRNATLAGVVMDMRRRGNRPHSQENQETKSSPTSCKG